MDLGFYFTVKGFFITFAGLLVSSAALIFAIIVTVKSDKVMKDTQNLIMVFASVFSEQIQAKGYEVSSSPDGRLHISVKIKVPSANAECKGVPPIITVTKN